MSEWSLQDAKNKLSALVNAALAGEPQHVTRRGHPAVVVLAAEEYDRLCRLERSQAPTLGELLLEIPQDDQEFQRLSLLTQQLRRNPPFAQELVYWLDRVLAWYGDHILPVCDGTALGAVVRNPRTRQR